MNLIDAKTVKRLEGLAPGVSAADSTTVSGLVLSGAVLADFSRDEREAINNRLLSYKRRIPSFGLFFQDVLFLELGANRMKKLIDKSKWWGPDDTEIGHDRERKLTLRERMEYMFRHRDTGSIMIQTPDGEEREVSGDEELQFDLAYRQLWLCALRSCSGSPGEGHKLATVRRSWTHPHEQYKLAQLAMALGFTSNSISQLTSRPFEPEYPPWYEFDDRHRTIELKRCGIPYTITFREDRKSLFVDRIHQATSYCDELDSAFILRDIYISFFGDLPSSVLGSRQRPRRDGGRGQTSGAWPSPTSRAQNRPSSGAAPSSTTMPPPTTMPRPTPQRETGRPATPAVDMNPQANSGIEQNAPGPSMHRAEVEQPGSRPTMPSETTEATTMPPTEPPMTPEETRDWRSELEALTNNLRKLRDDIDELGPRFDDPQFTDQQNAIIELRKLDAAIVEPTDIDTRGKLGAIEAEVTKRCSAIQSAKSHIHAVNGKVESEIQKLMAFTRNGEGTSEGRTQAAQDLPSARAVFEEWKTEYQKVDKFLTNVTSQIQPLQQQIGGFKVYLLGKCLIDLHHKFENCASDIDTIKQSVANLNTKLGPSAKPASHESEVKLLNDVRDDAITRVNAIWQELEAIRGAFQEAGGKPRSLSPRECESLPQTSATRLEMLNGEAENALAISKKQIQDVKGRLQTDYAKVMLRGKDEIQSQLDSEKIALENMKSNYEDAHSTIEGIRTALQEDRESLEEIIEDSILKRMGDLMAIDHLDGVALSMENMQEAHSNSVERLQNRSLLLEIALHTQAEIWDDYLNIRKDIAQRNEDQGKLLGCIQRQRESVHEFSVLTAETLQSKISPLLKTVQSKASETEDQLEVVRAADSLTAARQAIESAKKAAGESMRWAKQLQTVAELAKKGPHDLREHSQKGADDAMTSAKEAQSAVKTGQLFVKIWENADQKMESFLQRANKFKELLTNHSGPVLSQWMPAQPHDDAKDALHRVSNLAHKTCSLRKEMTNEIFSILDTVCESDRPQLAKRVNLRVPKFEQAALETLNAAFGLFYCVTQRTGDHTKSKLTEIENFSTSATEAIEKKDRDRWLIIVGDAREAKKCLDKAFELAEKGMNEAVRLKKATVDQEGSEGAIPGLALQHVEKTRECLQFGKDNQTEARQVLQNIEISWSRALASQKKETAQEVYDRACDAVGKIQPHHSLNDAEITRNAFKTMEDLFKVTEQDFEKCCGPNERFEEITEQFANVTNRAKSVIKGAEAVLSRVESGQFNTAQGNRSDAEVTDLQTKRTPTSEQDPAGDPSTLKNKSRGKRGRVGEPPRRMTRTQRKHQYVFIIKTIDGKPTATWERELHYTEAGRALQKGRELCARGRLCALNGELTKLGFLNPSGFETNIVDGGKVFFLGAEVEFEGVDFDLLLKKAQECYESCP
ncbi:hypothetical protein CNMCM7691_003889 [Aspergillus felis]|uniref:Uncharacterized protein n=1 Tax=Aspergillus felis TaxID=1287682 RepID=A0A8H6VA52_9EURO|nr:hypothetical protein CNMCM7691_003889 [Aspergillus felis]